MKVDCINSNREWCLFLCEGGWNSRALKNTYDQELQLTIFRVTRYMAIEGGSFFDATVRGFFGYHPPPVWPGVDVPAQQALDAALHERGMPRGFLGSLRNLRCILQEFTFFDSFLLVPLSNMSVEFTESHDCIEEQCAHRAGVFLCQLLITCHC